MHRYLFNINLVLRQQMAYRGDFYTTLLGMLLRITIYYFLWQVVAASGPGVNAGQLTTYSILGLILARGLDSRASITLGRALKDGSIAIYLLRPVDLQLTLLAQSLGENLNRLGLYGLPVFAAACLFFPVQAPASVGQALLFLASTAGGALIGGAFSYLMGVLTFWTTNDWGLTVFKGVMINALSGALVPLSLLPGGLRAALAWLPFQAMINQPIQVYLGQVTPLQAAQGIAIQLAWAAGLSLLARWLTRRATNTLTFQGG
jgi:ABC-2 type transport system permease protein